MERKLGAAFMVDIAGRMEGNPRRKLSAAWRDGIQVPAREVFDEENSTFGQIIEAIRRTPEEYAIDAHFFISSQGGDAEEVRDWKRFMTAIRSTEGTVSTQILGYGSSAAAWIFMLGDPGHRFMTSDGRVGLHNVTLQLGSAPGLDLSDPDAVGAWTRGNIRHLLDTSEEVKRDTESFLEAMPAEARERILRDAFSKVGAEILILNAAELESAGVVVLTNEEITERVLNQILKIKD